MFRAPYESCYDPSRMPSSKCCRSCPRCNDCPVLLAAAARARRREVATTSSLIDDVLSGVGLRSARSLPESVTRTLEALDAARRGEPVTADFAGATA
jgi:hypothetical protein